MTETADENNEDIKHERIRVKKRVKIKKKSDPKSKVKKIMSRIMWLTVVIMFLYALYILVRESDIRDKDKNFFTPPAVKGWLRQIVLSGKQSPFPIVSYCKYIS